MSFLSIARALADMAGGAVNELIGVPSTSVDDTYDRGPTQFDRFGRAPGPSLQGFSGYLRPLWSGGEDLQFHAPAPMYPPPSQAPPNYLWERPRKFRIVQLPSVYEQRFGPGEATWPEQRFVGSPPSSG